MTSDRGSLWDRVFTAAGSSGAKLHCWTGAAFVTATWAEVVRDAERMTAGLRRHGVRPGARVAAVLTNSPSAVRGVLAVWLAGGTLASLPVPARGMSFEEYTRQLGTMCAQLEPELFVVDETLLGLVPAGIAAGRDALSWESLADSGRVPATPPEHDDVAFVQYSSGSTSTPKGCLLSARAIAAQLDLIMAMLEGEPGRDVTVSWLPLSHDMGMFGCLLTPLAHGFDLCLSTPERFTLSPRTWFGDVADFGANITVGTNTALHLAARAHANGRARLGGPLALKTCILGAERVEWETMRFATETFAGYGFRETAFMPAYGLAEATLAVTHTPLHEPPAFLSLDAAALAAGELVAADPAGAGARLLVSAGVPAAGVRLPGVPEAAVGEVRVSSPSLGDGYWADPDRTRAHFHDGTLLTNDLGFLRDGRFYPVGRSDDMLTVAGRKVYAQEIERAIDTIGVVRRGCSSLLSEGGRLTLFAELSERVDDYTSVALRAADVAMAKAAVALDECVFLERGSLPKTPSGKIQRHRCAALRETGGLDPLAVIELGRKRSGG
ncbi:AMP-binding protein [Amycolatopsis sp. NPDC005003]